jgi:hypothetical protein
VLEKFGPNGSGAVEKVVSFSRGSISAEVGGHDFAVSGHWANGKTAYTFGLGMASTKNCARLIWLLSGVASLAGCSADVPGEPSGSIRTPISGGQPDATNTNVFGLLVHGEDGVAACSSTLIAENLLLTARHCVASGGSDPVVCGRAAFGDTYAPSGVVASNAVDVTRANEWYRGKEIFVPTEGNDTCGFDVALIVLSERVPAAVAKPAVPRIDRDVAKGEEYHAVGYGLTETSDYGVRRLLGQREVQCDPGTCRSGVRGNEFIGSSGPCEGDSGGPAFDVDGKVVGVDSRGTEECETPVYSTVTGWKDLIVETARHAAMVGGYEPPFWVTTGLSDPPVTPPPPAVTVPIGGQCDSTSACVVGSACYLPANASTAECVKVCKSSSECSADEDCVPANDQVSVCLGVPPASSSGCQFSRARSSAFGGASLTFAFAFGFAFALRRRRPRTSL